MKTKSLFYRKMFLVSVALLLLNDFYLKAQFHNYFTGKLSDFVGLFAFPYFFSVLFKKKIKLIYILTGVLFIFWKSSTSQFFIDHFNELGIGLYRVVDYSDAMALFILPISYQYRIKRLVNINTIKWLPKPIIIGISLFAFVATTLLTEYGELNLKSNYQVELETSKDSVLMKLPNTYKVNNDSRYQTLIHIPKKRSQVIITLEILEIEHHKTLIRLDSIKGYNTRASGLFFGGVKKKHVTYVKNLKLEDFEQLFIEQKINELKKTSN